MEYESFSFWNVIALVDHIVVKFLELKNENTRWLILKWCCHYQVEK